MYRGSRPLPDDARGWRLNDEVMSNTTPERSRHRNRWRVSGLIVAGAMALGLAGVAAGPSLATQAQRSAGDDRVTWLNRHATPLATTDPGKPVDDLAGLRGIARDARIVGLGESTHGSAEQFRVKHRAVRFLVERMGYRSIAFEEDFASGVAIDRYIVTGVGDPRALIMATGSIWATEEMLDLVRWLRAYNTRRPASDQVRFLGSDLHQIRQLSFDEIRSYTQCAAPGRLDELDRISYPIRMRGSASWEQMQWYGEQTDKQPYIDSARQLVAFVRGLPAKRCALAHDVAVQHAAVIAGWYEFYGLEPTQSANIRERFIADSVTWWQTRTGHRTAYWAANLHTTASPDVTRSEPPAPPVTRPAVAGTHLRNHYGRSYVAIAIVFHEGQVLTGWGSEQGPQPHHVGPPGPELTDHTLGQARHPDYLINLHAPAPDSVRDWLTGPARMTGIPSRYNKEDSTGLEMTFGSLAGGFDAIFHIRNVTPNTLLQ